MLYSGISWDDQAGYELVALDQDANPVGPARRFGSGQVDHLVAHLRDLGPTVTVLDSANGVIGGHLVTAGLTVYRADSHLLPPPPDLGSVSAEELARTGLSKLSALVRMESITCGQTGREPVPGEGNTASGTVSPEPTTVGRYVSRGPGERHEIALTFDDGPCPPYTGRILDILHGFGVAATFFCIGLNAAGHPELTRRIHEEGHVLANHTWSHPFLPELTRAQTIQQVRRTADQLAELSGGARPALLRPPYGAHTPQVMQWLVNTGATVVLWDVAPYDWTCPGEDMIVQHTLARTQPGSIILLHDGGGDRSQTVAALPRIIEGLLARDYRFVLVDDLLAARAGGAAGGG